MAESNKRFQDFSIFQVLRDQENVSSYVLLKIHNSANSLMDDGKIYNCIVLDSEGQIRNFTLHEKELMNMHCYVSRKIKFI